MTEAVKKQIVQRITRNLLDIQILRLIQEQPMWGYIIKKQIETKFNVKIRHGALYPLLNRLEEENFLTCQKQTQTGRTRKVYEIAGKGKEYLKAYEALLKDQLHNRDIK